MVFLRHLKSLIGGRRVDVSSRFTLLDESAAGTMSKFYMARDLRSGEIVGLKILDREKTAAFESRFKGLKKPSEGEIAKQLKHPHVVETREHGTTTDGSPFLVMEYLEGADVQALFASRDARLEGNRLRMLREAAEAVEAVHVAGFVHRDLCPRNLLFTKHGTKLIDFGLTVPAYGRFLEPGVRVGNPNYMAPEVIRRKPIDQRLDVFAFGVTAYKICSQELPWRAGTTGMAAMSHNQKPVDIREHRPKLDPILARAIHWCLESDAERRCPSMQKLLETIRGLDREEVG